MYMHVCVVCFDLDLQMHFGVSTCVFLHLVFWPEGMLGPEVGSWNYWEKEPEAAAIMV